MPNNTTMKPKSQENKKESLTKTIIDKMQDRINELELSLEDLNKKLNKVADRLGL